MIYQEQPPLITLENPYKQIYHVNYNITKDITGEYSCDVLRYDHRPTVDEIVSDITTAINKSTDINIVSGMRWNGIPVWLSMENQFNYKVIYDLVKDTNGATLPVTFKFGTDLEPVYVEFDTVEKLSDFYLSSIKYVQVTLQNGFNLKNNIDRQGYELALSEIS